MANTFKYQTIWTKEYQKSNWAMPVYPVIADTQFKQGLSIGDTVKRRYRTNPIFAKTLGSDGSYSAQNYVENEESYTISKQKEATVRIVKPEVLHTDMNVAQSYGVQLSNALYQEIDGDTLNAARAAAGTTLDDGSFGGTSGNGLTVGIANIANIPVIALETFQGKNVVYNNNMKFGKLPYEDYGGMLCWIVPPQVWTVIQNYMMARGTPKGDDAVTNGYMGQFGQFNVFVSNNLPYTATFALSVQPTDGDTVTIKGVTFTFKTALSAGPAVAGEVVIGANAAASNTNLTAALNALRTTTATFTAFTDGTDTLSEGGFTTNKSDNGALHGISATATSTSTAIVMKGTGKVTVSQSMTSALNKWTAAKQNVHSLFVIGKNISLAVRQDPEIYENFVSDAVAKDYVMWTVYDNKVFIDQARGIIDLAIDCSATSFAAYSNVHA